MHVDKKTKLQRKVSIFMSMKNIKLLNKESHTTVALAVLCQDYVLTDQEFMESERIKEKMQSTGFWIDVAHNLYGVVSVHLANNMDTEGYDDFDAPDVNDEAVLNYAIDPANRFELNDMICESIETWLKNSKNRKR